MQGGTSSGGRLLGDQQLEELNTQLSTARAAAEEAKARLERITEVMKRDVPDATVADSLRNEVINRLRNNYLDLAAKEAIWSARYGSTHLGCGQSAHPDGGIASFDYRMNSAGSRKATRATMKSPNRGSMAPNEAFKVWSRPRSPRTAIGWV